MRRNPLKHGEGEKLVMLHNAVMQSKAALDLETMGFASLLKKMRSVQTVATVGNTVGAAECLNLSQSAVVRAIQDVEAALAFQVFERSARGMRPTPLGQLVIHRIGRALDLLSRIDRHKVQPAADALTRAPWQSSRLASALAYRHMQAFLSLLDTGHEKRTAAALGISQSAVHQTLSQLEHMAGEALFYRDRNGLRATESGETAQKFIKLALAELSQAEEEVTAHKGELQGRIVIGTLPFSTGLFVPRALEDVLARHPGLKVTVVDGTYASLLHQLRFADIDIIVGALRATAPGPDVQQETLFEDGLAVVARRDHPLAARRLKSLKDLDGVEWIMPMPGTPAQEAFDQSFQAEGLSPPSASLRVNSPIMMQALLAASDRVALMSPRQVDREVKAGLLRVLPIPVRHAARRIGITTRTGFLPPPGAKQLLDAFRAVARQIERENPVRRNKQIA
jgi:LysR family transcriptional regulator of gallate degradation